jgi:flavin-dependent dehydrogenase
LTGEGIGHAILSGQMAARAIASALRGGDADLEPYQRDVDKHITPQLRSARTFSRILGLMPKRLFNLIKLDSRTWHAGGALVRGETTYSDIMGRIKSLGGIYSLMMRR